MVPGLSVAVVVLPIVLVIQVIISQKPQENARTVFAFQNNFILVTLQMCAELDRCAANLKFFAFLASLFLPFSFCNSRALSKKLRSAGLIVCKLALKVCLKGCGLLKRQRNDCPSNGCTMVRVCLTLRAKSKRKPLRI